MPNIIHQSVYFPATPAHLFNIFLDESLHAQMTGAPAAIDPRVGGTFRQFDGLLWGTTLAITPARLLIQSWRSINFKKTDLDSTLILTFTKKRQGCQLDLLHVNVPKQDFKGVTNGWKKFYWTPLKTYLKSHPK